MSTNDAAVQQSGGMAAVLRLRDFRLLWIGQAASLLGDQFYLIALPWLVLQLTHDPMALGLVLAAAGVPRALFMLVGGAITDRFSPRVVMLVSDVARLVCIGAVAALVLSGGAQMWMLVALSVVFGLVSGFFTPASSAIVPALVEGQDLKAGNAIFQGTGQISAFLGPALAGWLIAWGERQPGGVQPGAEGIALAFGIDALTFLVSIVTLWLMRGGGQAHPDDRPGGQDLIAEIGEGIRYTLREPLLSALLGLIAAINLLFAGPFLVGVAVLADTRLPEGAAAYGLILSGHAGGLLAGYVIAGSMPRVRRLGLVVPPLFGMFGVGLIALGLTASTWAAFGVLAVLGLAEGFIGIVVITWIQQRTNKALLGRVMSLVMFFHVGLIPISQALAGVASAASLTGVLIGCGAAILAITAWIGMMPVMRTAEA